MMGPLPLCCFWSVIKARNEKQNRKQVKQRKVSLGALWEPLPGKAYCHTESVSISQGTVPPGCLTYATAIGMQNGLYTAKAYR